MSEDKTLFTPEQQELAFELWKIIKDFKLLDPKNTPDIYDIEANRRSGSASLLDYYKPEFRSINNPIYQYVACWQSYLSYAKIHGFPMNKKGTKHNDNSNERRGMLNHLTAYLGHKPTSKDLKEFFQLPPEFDEICEVIDRDIKSLL